MLWTEPNGLSNGGIGGRLTDCKHTGESSQELFDLLPSYHEPRGQRFLQLRSAQVLLDPVLFDTSRAPNEVPTVVTTSELGGTKLGDLVFLFLGVCQLTTDASFGSLKQRLGIQVPASNRPVAAVGDQPATVRTDSY